MDRKFKTEVLTIQTAHACQLVDITDRLGRMLQDRGMNSGILTVFCPHTTAGITINEAADPDVKRDLLLALDSAFPCLPQFRHLEGNSSAHIKASVMGSSCQVIVEEGQLKLGTWQGIYLCEFDGPRNRTVLLKFLSE